MSAVCLAGAVNTLFMFNLTSEEWADRSGGLTGDPAPASFLSGFTTASGKLYVHGGLSGRSDALSEYIFAL